MVFRVSTNVYTRTRSQSKQYIKSEVLFFYYVRSYVCTDIVLFRSTLSRTFVLYIKEENACVCRQVLSLLHSSVIHVVHK